MKDETAQDEGSCTPEQNVIAAPVGIFKISDPARGDGTCLCLASHLGRRCSENPWRSIMLSSILSSVWTD